MVMVDRFLPIHLLTLEATTFSLYYQLLCILLKSQDHQKCNYRFLLICEYVAVAYIFLH